MKMNKAIFSLTALLAASPHGGNAFSPNLLAQKPFVAASGNNVVGESFLPRHGQELTRQHLVWPGKEEATKEAAEGKREESRLNLVVTAVNEASLTNLFSDITSTEDLEEFVAPVTDILDDATGGWALSYANLEPENEATPVGISFLATNLAYGIAGSLLVTQGNTLLGVLTEVACLASFIYHFSQLKLGQSGSRIVRLALLVDYVFALTAIIVGSIQLATSHQFPEEVLFGGSLAVASLGACWMWEEGLTYIFFHSLWHLFSAYTGYVIGSAVSV